MAAKPKVATMSAKAFSASTFVLFLICLMYGITYIDRNNVSTVASIFKRDLHLTNMQIGLVYSAFAYPYLIFQIIGGLVDCSRDVARFVHLPWYHQPGLGHRVGFVFSGRSR